MRWLRHARRRRGVYVIEDARSAVHIVTYDGTNRAEVRAAFEATPGLLGAVVPTLLDHLDAGRAVDAEQTAPVWVTLQDERAVQPAG